LPEPAGDGIVLQQFGDGGKIPEQLLFWVRHKFYLARRLFHASATLTGWPSHLPRSILLATE
jgi:hypothetical protein